MKKKHVLIFEETIISACILLLLLLLLLLLYSGLEAVLSQYKVVEKDQNIRNHLAQIIGNGDSMHEMYVYSTKDTSRMGTVRVKQEEGADTKRIVKECYEIWNSQKCGHY